MGKTKSVADILISTINYDLATEIYNSLKVINENVEYTKLNEIHQFLCNHEDAIELISLMADSHWKGYRQFNKEAFLINPENYGTLSPTVMAFTKDDKTQAIWMDDEGISTKIIQYDQSGTLLKALDLTKPEGQQDITAQVLGANDTQDRNELVKIFNSSLSTAYESEYREEMKSGQKDAFIIPYNSKTHFLVFTKDTYKVIDHETYKCENPHGPCFLKMRFDEGKCSIEINGQIEDRTEKDVVTYLSEKREEYRKNLTSPKI